MLELLKPGSPLGFLVDKKQLMVGTEKPFVVIPKHGYGDGAWRLFEMKARLDGK